MTTTLAPRADAVRPAHLLPAYRFELAKQLTQWRIRALLVACLLGPGGFVAVVSRQSTLPTDTVFGRSMHATGWAGSLVVLGFACGWGLPLLVSLVAGDVFAAEDRLGTWSHLLVAVRSPRRIFVAKALGSLTVVGLMVTVLCASSIFGGLAAVGSHPLIGLDGHVLSPGDAAGAVVVAWLCVLAPTLALAAVGLLGSVLLGRSPMGLLVPAMLALAMDLALMLPLPVAVRLSLPTNTFLAWRGVFTEPARTGPLLVGIVVCLAWAALATGLALHRFVRRDFTDLSYDGAGPRALAATVLPLAVLVGLTALVLAAAAPLQTSGIGKDKLEASLSTSFAHLYRLQTDQLHRPAVTEAELHAHARCDKGGDHVHDRGPGNDWRCVVVWRLPGSSAQGAATYQLDVSADGRYVADGDGPREVNGNFWVRTPSGAAPNPLWQLDGYVELI